MASYADNDLISFGDFSSGPIVSPASFSSIRKSMATSGHRSTAQRDSFSDLAGLMKAKKPYTPIPPPTPRSSLSNASNGMQFASRTLSGQSILSPTAKPFVGPGSVSSWLREQEKMPTAPTTHVPEYRQTDIDRLEAMTSWIHDFPIDDETERRPRTPTPPTSSTPPLLLELQSPPRIGPIAPPTPAESIQPPVSAYDHASVPIVRVGKAVWDSMGNDISSLMKQKRVLEEQLASIKRDHQALRDEDHDVGAQLGKLRYQNEANRDQKAAMGRSLAQKDVEIKSQQLEIDNLNHKVVELEAEITRRGQVMGEGEWLRSTIKDIKAAHARDLEAQAANVTKLEETLQQVTLERNAAIRGQVSDRDHVTRAQNLADTLSKREKLITDLRQKTLEEQIRADDLEDEVERLKEQMDQGNLDDLKERLREKSSQCDRVQTQLKGTEQQLSLARSRLMTAANGGDFLRGGAHLVAPNQKSKLPKMVVSCSECYAKNITCDSGARCRNCTETNVQCARWRCSLKHKLGECHMAPCNLPHDPQGWLVLMDPRPQW